MTDYMIRFPKGVAVPLSSGVRWSNGTASLRIVDSGYKCIVRYAVCRENGTVVGFAQSMPQARILCQRVAK